MATLTGARFVLMEPQEGVSLEDAKEAVMEALQGLFRREFLNCVDEFMMFDPQGKTQMGERVRLLVRTPAPPKQVGLVC